MKDERARRLLLGVPAPDELDAERRSWALVRAAYEEADVAPARRWPIRPLVAFAVVLALVAAALTPPGRAVSGWIRERVAADPEPAGPLLASLPARGSILAVAETGAWVVHADGSKRRLGAYDDASWSPHGLHAVVTRGPRVVAVTPAGEVRWTVTRQRDVHDPRWSPSGFRIAYRVESDLRVVHGDGEPDRRITRDAAAVPAAWHPDAAANVLTYADRGGRVRVVDVDLEEELWSGGPGPPVRHLAWSADGERLYVARRGGADRLFGRGGRVVRPSVVPGGAPVGSAAFAPEGPRLATTHYVEEEQRTAVRITNVESGRSRVLLETAGRLTQATWSPDGTWLLLANPAADQWVFVRPAAPHEIRTVTGVARELDPGGEGPAAFPALRGWCC